MLGQLHSYMSMGWPGSAVMHQRRRQLLSLELLTLACLLGFTHFLMAT